MNKEEINKWIEQNNPFLANKSTAEILKNHPMSLAWTAGAKSMAEHLQSQPPTAEQIEKVLDLLFWCCKEYTPTDNEEINHVNYIREQKRLKNKIFRYAWKIVFLGLCENKTKRKYFLKCRKKSSSFIEAELKTLRIKIK